MNSSLERGRPARECPGPRAVPARSSLELAKVRNSSERLPPAHALRPGTGRAPHGPRAIPARSSPDLTPTLKNFARLPALLLTLLSFLSISLLAADTTRAPAPAAAPTVPDVSFSVLRVFGALALVFALFLGAVWLFRNWQRLTLNRGRPSKLNVLEVRALGQRHAIYVIGYQHQRVLLGTSPAGVSLLSHLPDDDSPPEAQPRPATFAEVWQHLRERKP